LRTTYAALRGGGSPNKKTITIDIPDEEKVGDKIPFHVISTYLPPRATAIRWEKAEDKEEEK
jgi:hypothetical protein